MKQSGKVLNGLIDVIHNELSSGENASLIGFGTFSVADRKTKVVQDPKTGEKMEVEARKVPVSKAGSTLK